MTMISARFCEAHQMLIISEQNAALQVWTLDNATEEIRSDFGGTGFGGRESDDPECSFHNELDLNIQYNNVSMTDI
uniref:Uncharacterized protein n=1 Tax=Oryza meridionalis TaxID=40149 RepID=A0A0E0E660_9ORYZ